MKDDYLKLAEVSRRSSMSVRTIKKHIREIKHYRPTPRSPILVKWEDFEAWMDRGRKDAQEDPDVHAILERISGAVA